MTLRLTICALGVWALAVGGCSGPQRVGDPSAKPLPLVKDLTAAESLLGQKVHVAGRAVRTKLSAAVSTGDLVVYLIDVPEWPETVQGEMVKATGVLERTDRYQAARDSSGAISTGTEGPVLVLRNARWTPEGTPH